MRNYIMSDQLLKILWPHENAWRINLEERQNSQLKLQLLHFQHIETENDDQTIELFENVMEKCQRHGDPVSDHLQQRMLL